MSEQTLTTKQRRAQKVMILLQSTVPVYLLAVFIALLIGAVLIKVSGASPIEGYLSLIRGSLFDWEAKTTVRQFKPLTDTLVAAAPLIIAGLGLGFGFRAGLFNIGAKGQIIMGGLAAVWVGIKYDLPDGVHVLACLLAATIAGSLYAFIVGYLKATTGANEVIVTIMLNSIASLLLVEMLKLDAWQIEGSDLPKTPTIPNSAKLPQLLPAYNRLTAGILVAVAAAIFVWWYLERSTWGLELRAVGANPHAAKTAGMSIGKVTALTMTLSGALCGLAGGTLLTGQAYNVNDTFGGSVGIDAITVALLGRNKPGGVFAAGLLFGAFKVGGLRMDSSANVPADMVLILQSVIVLLIMAPEFIRWAFRIPSPEKIKARSFITLEKKEVAA